MQGNITCYLLPMETYTPQRETPISESIPEEKTRSNKLLIIIGFLVLLIIVLLGILAVWLFNKDTEGGSSDDATQKNCVYAGVQYSNGARFDATDGCNTCTCENGSVSCTEIDCTQEDEEDDTKEVSFSLEGDADAVIPIPFSLDFLASIPNDANVDTSRNTTETASPRQEVVISGDTYELSLYLFYDAEVTSFASAEELGKHTQFKSLYRGSDANNTIHNYLNELTQDESCMYIGKEFDPPCGTPAISLEENIFFFAECKADARNVSICDDIMSSLAVEIRRLD